jgi:hypothetical protein
VGLDELAALLESLRGWDELVDWAEAEGDITIKNTELRENWQLEINKS